MFVIIGCPIYKRDWILPDWFAAIKAQDFPFEDLGFVFELSPDDPETLEMLLEFSAKNPQVRCFDIRMNAIEAHQDHPEGGRYWDDNRYRAMARMRNNLMDNVTVREPDRYFSLDSDILLEDPKTIATLVKLTDQYGAVSPLLFMTPDGGNFPNVMSWVVPPQDYRGCRNPYPLGTFFQADIIMAAVMMSKPVYQQTRYQYHRQGEDLGWSVDCAAKNFKLYSASYLYCPHIMSKQMLQRYKVEGDFRKPLFSF